MWRHVAVGALIAVSAVAACAARPAFGTDRIYGLEGNDRLDVRGGGRDFVDCGPGRDVVRADRRDVVARNCERPRR